MPLKIWCIREMPLQFSNFEKCYFMPFLVAFFEVWSGVFQSLQNVVAFFKVCKNCSDIFQSLEIAMAFLRNTKFGVAFIKLTQNKNNWASCWVPDVTRSLCNSLVYWLRWQWHGTQMSEIHYEEPFFYWIEIRRHFACVLPWPWRVLAVILSTYNHLLVVYASTW